MVWGDHLDGHNDPMAPGTPFHGWQHIENVLTAARKREGHPQPATTPKLENQKGNQVVNRTASRIASLQHLECHGRVSAVSAVSLNKLQPKNKLQPCWAHGLLQILLDHQQFLSGWIVTTQHGRFPPSSLANAVGTSAVEMFVFSISLVGFNHATWRRTASST